MTETAHLLQQMVYIETVYIDMIYLGRKASIVLTGLSQRVSILIVYNPE